ncbi:virulence RhuM family protein [Puia sp. P3]|uniref:virulence RhuM family protein n=1 Tax=Puia sp. P3 TaxID=3423952 RepID=UPI003D67B734
MKEKGDIIFYESGSDSGRIEVKLENETVWLSLNQIAVLFDKNKSVISRHLSNVYRDGELDKASTVAKNATVQNEGGREITRDIEYYNLDAILSVGYRVNSIRGTQFRIWANKVLKDYLTKGYAIDQKRFKDQSRQLDELKQTVKLLGNPPPQRNFFRSRRHLPDFRRKGSVSQCRGKGRTPLIFRH